MKIASLLPSATEIVYALGLGDDLIGVTDECDYPADAVTKPVISRSALPQGRPLSSREIDAAVRAQTGDGQALYVLDTDLLRRERPDVILTQDLCRVCAVPSGQVQRALDQIGLPDAKVVSLDPHTLDEVISQLEVVGKLLGAEDRGREIATRLRERVAAVRETAKRVPSVSVFCLEWSDPPFSGGHWIPEMVEACGAVPVLAAKGEPSREVAWHEVRMAAPEVVVYMPCGFYLEEAEEAAEEFLAHPEFADTPAARNGHVFAVDATSYFSRPGPRIVDGLEILAWAVHPEAYPEPPAGTIARLASVRHG
jgi:iron complex transport system substrate-binding protein